MARKTRSASTNKAKLPAKKIRRALPLVKREIQSFGEICLGSFKKNLPGENDEDRISRLMNQQKLVHLIIAKADASCAYCRDLKVCIVKLHEIQSRWFQCRDDERFGNFFYTSEMEHCKIQFWRVLCRAIQMTQNEKTFKEFQRDYPDVNATNKEFVEAMHAFDAEEEDEEDDTKPKEEQEVEEQEEINQENSQTMPLLEKVH